MRIFFKPKLNLFLLKFIKMDKLHTLRKETFAISRILAKIAKVCSREKSWSRPFAKVYSCEKSRRGHSVNSRKNWNFWYKSKKPSCPLFVSLKNVKKTRKNFLFGKVYSREKFQKERFAKVCSREKFRKRPFAKVNSKNFAIFSARESFFP